MHPVGYYDLREAASPVPVVSTAFRPVDPDELARNPFRVFTSMLAMADARFFAADLRDRVDRFLAQRQLFDPALIASAQADRRRRRMLDAPRPASSSRPQSRHSRCPATRSTSPGTTSSPRCPRSPPTSPA